MNAYPITTLELLVIAVKEVGKEIPGIGGIIGAHEAVFGAIEANRIKHVLEEVFRRLEELEGKRPHVFDQKACGVLLFGADQVRGDILAESKKAEYGNAIAHYCVEDADLNEVYEVLDSLRKLSSDDLKLLHEFRVGEALFEKRLVAELAGYKRYGDPFTKQAVVRDGMEKLYPSLMRLEGLGVIYLSHDPRGGGEIYPEIGGLSEHLKKLAFLTFAGKRLVKVLPGVKKPNKAPEPEALCAT